MLFVYELVLVSNLKLRLVLQKGLHLRDGSDVVTVNPWEFNHLKHSKIT